MALINKSMTIYDIIGVSIGIPIIFCSINQFMKEKNTFLNIFDMLYIAYGCITKNDLKVLLIVKKLRTTSVFTFCHSRISC